MAGEGRIALWWAGRCGTAEVRTEQGVVVGVRPVDGGPEQAADWSVLPGIVDHHVHLGLVDQARLACSPVVEVHDLGWDPEEILRIRAAPPAGVRVRVAGPFHTAAGGYPSGRPWAPSAAVRTVGSPEAAEQAVREAVANRYHVLKVVLHAGAPLLGDRELEALVKAAHAAGLRVAVHAEGPGQVARAAGSGADVLVHTPWEERLPEDLLDRAAGMTWLSTLAIHSGADLARATDNLGRFHSRGGTVRYGTDMGNGPTPVGPWAEEIIALGAAGLEGDPLLRALTGDPRDLPSPDRLLAAPLPIPRTAPDVVTWLAASRRLASIPSEEFHVRP